MKTIINLVVNIYGLILLGAIEVALHNSMPLFYVANGLLIAGFIYVTFMKNRKSI